MTNNFESGRVYQLVNGSGLVLTAAAGQNNNGRAVTLNANMNRADQLWRAVQASEGFVFLENTQYPGFFLDAHQPDVMKNGCGVHMWDAVGQQVTTHKHWKLEAAGNDLHFVVCRPSLLVLDAHEPDAAKAGCRIQLFHRNAGTPPHYHQKWRVVQLP